MLHWHLLFVALACAVKGFFGTDVYKEEGVYIRIQSFLEKVIKEMVETKESSMHDIFEKRPQLQIDWLTLFDVRDCGLSDEKDKQVALDVVDLDLSDVIVLPARPKTKDTNVQPESAVSWKDFTPEIVDEAKCLARQWNGGKGGQCSYKPLSGRNVCHVHIDKHTGDPKVPHGYVNGPIPDDKFR